MCVSKTPLSASTAADGRYNKGIGTAETKQPVHQWGIAAEGSLHMTHMIKCSASEEKREVDCATACHPAILFLYVPWAHAEAKVSNVRWGDTSGPWIWERKITLDSTKYGMRMTKLENTMPMHDLILL